MKKQAKTVDEFKFQMRADVYGDTRGRSLTVPLIRRFGDRSSAPEV